MTTAPKTDAQGPQPNHLSRYIKNYWPGHDEAERADIYLYSLHLLTHYSLINTISAPEGDLSLRIADMGGGRTRVMVKNGVAERPATDEECILWDALRVAQMSNNAACVSDSAENEQQKHTQAGPIQRFDIADGAAIAAVEGQYVRHDDHAAALSCCMALKAVPVAPQPTNAAATRMRKALERIASWPDGGTQYGQDNIKSFARVELDAAAGMEATADQAPDLQSMLGWLRRRQSWPSVTISGRMVEQLADMLTRSLPPSRVDCGNCPAISTGCEAGKCLHAADNAKNAGAGTAQNANPVAWAAVCFGGKRDGKIYSTSDTKAQIDAYIQQIHQSDDGITLRARPIAFADAPSTAPCPPSSLPGNGLLGYAGVTRTNGLPSIIGTADIQRFADAVLKHAPEQHPIARWKRDSELLEIINDNCWDVRYLSSSNGDDCDVGIEIVGHYMAKPHERVLGENWNQNLRAALEQATTADAYPPARPVYDQDEELEEQAS